MNNRAMLNICATITFPAIPEITFDLVLATKSYKSALLDAAQDGGDVDLDDIAAEVYRKTGRNIMATFKSALQAFGVPSTGEYFIVADRAEANVSVFGRRFICC